MSGIESNTDEMSLAPQRSLDLVATLLSEPRLWTSWLAEHPDRSETFAEAFRRVVRLEQCTGWETEVLLRQLGCKTKTTKELARMGPGELQRCSSYFGWVEDLAALADVTRDRREIVSRAALLYRDVGGDLEECRTAMNAGRFSAAELLALGETERAWIAGQLEISGPIGESARRVQRTNPFVEDRPHLSNEKLDQYLGLREPELGPTIQRRIDDHLAICDECRSASEARVEAGRTAARRRVAEPAA